MSTSEILTTLLDLLNSDDLDDQKLIKYADFSIHHRNLAYAQCMQMMDIFFTVQFPVLEHPPLAPEIY